MRKVGLILKKSIIYLHIKIYRLKNKKDAFNIS